MPSSTMSNFDSKQQDSDADPFFEMDDVSDASSDSALTKTTTETRSVSTSPQEDLSTKNPKASFEARLCAIFLEQFNQLTQDNSLPFSFNYASLPTLIKAFTRMAINAHLQLQLPWYRTDESNNYIVRHSHENIQLTTHALANKEYLKRLYSTRHPITLLPTSDENSGIQLHDKVKGKTLTTEIICPNSHVPAISTLTCQREDLLDDLSHWIKLREEAQEKGSKFPDKKEEIAGYLKEINETIKKIVKEINRSTESLIRYIFNIQAKQNTKELIEYISAANHWICVSTEPVTEDTFESMFSELTVKTLCESMFKTLQYCTGIKSQQPENLLVAAFMMALKDISDDLLYVNSNYIAYHLKFVGLNISARDIVQWESLVFNAVYSSNSDSNQSIALTAKQIGQIEQEEKSNSDALKSLYKSLIGAKAAFLEHQGNQAKTSTFNSYTLFGNSGKENKNYSAEFMKKMLDQFNSNYVEKDNCLYALQQIIKSLKESPRILNYSKSFASLLLDKIAQNEQVLRSLNIDTNASVSILNNYDKRIAFLERLNEAAQSVELKRAYSGHNILC